MQLCAPVPSSRDRRKGPTVAFSVPKIKLLYMGTICCTKFRAVLSSKRKPQQKHTGVDAQCNGDILDSWVVGHGERVPFIRYGSVSFTRLKGLKTCPHANSFVLEY